MARANSFSRKTQRAALVRQKNRCACCGETISALGHEGQATHRFGEGVHAHHMRHVRQGGTNAVENCVILCWSCHYSVHEGGNYRRGTVDSSAEDYPHFNGQGAPRLRALRYGEAGLYASAFVPLRRDAPNPQAVSAHAGDDPSCE